MAVHDAEAVAIIVTNKGTEVGGSRTLESL
jgi:hypothetical protein